MWRIKKYFNTGDCSNYCTLHVPSPPSRLTYTIILEMNVSYVLYIMSLTACLALFRSFFALDLDIAQNLIVTAYVHNYAHIKILFCHYYIWCTCIHTLCACALYMLSHSIHGSREVDPSCKMTIINYTVYCQSQKRTIFPWRISLIHPSSTTFRALYG